eukprot:3629754-Prymnesium_polylepis.3
MAVSKVHVTVCTGFASPKRLHLSSWIDFHIDVAGVDSFLLHDDTPHTDHAARKEVERVLAPLRETGIVEMLPRSRWHWRDEVPLGPGIRARFVGQTDFLTRCLTTAAARHATRASESWLIHIDIDEYLMPTVRVDPQTDGPRTRLTPNASASTLRRGRRRWTSAWARRCVERPQRRRR